MTTLKAFQRAERRHSKRARDYGVIDTLTAAQIQQCFETQAGLCYWCRKEVTNTGMTCMVVDHLNSMSKGGANALDNIVIACLKCNIQKNTVPADVFAARTGHADAPTIEQQVYRAIEAGGKMSVDCRRIALNLGKRSLDQAEAIALQSMAQEGVIEVSLTRDTRAPSGIKMLYRVKE